MGQGDWPVVVMSAMGHSYPIFVPTDDRSHNHCHMCCLYTLAASWVDRTPVTCTNCQSFHLTSRLLT